MRRALLLAALMLVVAALSFAAVPQGWFVAGWAGLWMRIDAGSVAAGFDNMQDRAIQGTTDWTRYSVVLDIPLGSTAVNFGILLDGKGSVWLSGVTFEVVGADVPVTAVFTTPSAPQNLDFRQ